MFNAATFNSITFNSTVGGKNRDLSIVPVAGGDATRVRATVGIELDPRVQFPDTEIPSMVMEAERRLSGMDVALAAPQTMVGHPAAITSLGSVDADASVDADGPYDAGSVYSERFPSGMGTATIIPVIGREDVPDDTA